MIIQRKYILLLLLFIGYLVVYIDKTVIGLAMISIREDLNLTPKDIGNITGLFFLSYSLFQIPAGWLNDRIGYKKVLLLSLTAIGICSFLFGYVGTTISLLTTFRFLAGIGHAGYPCSSAKAVASNFSVDERTLAQSILLSSAGIAMIIGPVAVNYMLEKTGWRCTYIYLSLLVIMVMMFVLIGARSEPNSNNKNNLASGGKFSYRFLIKNPVVILLFIAIFGVNIPAYGLMVWLPNYLVDVRGLDKNWVASIMAIAGVAQWLSSIGSGWFVGKYMKNKERNVILISSILSAACIWCVFISTNIVLSTLCLFFAYIFLMFSFITIFTLPMKWLPSNITGSAVGLVNTGGTLGGFVSPIVIGHLLSNESGGMSGDFSFAFMFLAGGMILSALAVIPLKKPKS